MEICSRDEGIIDDPSFRPRFEEEEASAVEGPSSASISSLQFASPVLPPAPTDSGIIPKVQQYFGRSCVVKDNTLGLWGREGLRILIDQCRQLCGLGLQTRFIEDRSQASNVVSSVDLGCKLDLLKIALRLRNAEYNPKRFHAVIMRILEPRTAALIFRSGKIVVTGARSETAAHLAARKYARLIQKLGFDVKFIDFKVQNMVASCDVKFPIQIENLYTSHCQFSSYEPELFPGLIYRLVQPRVVLLVFVSGKIVLTGAKSRGELKESFENMYPILKAFRKL